MENLVLKIKKALEVKCDSHCNHQSCPKSLIPTGSQKKNVISNGRFRKVYRLTDPETNFEYAVKSIEINPKEINEEDRGLERSINEYRDKIKHPRIIDYFGSILYSPKIYIFMEYFPKSLYNEIPKEGSLSHQKIVQFTQQILEGLEFLHAKNYMHRNIKPDHILLDEKDQVKICGFRLSKELQSISVQSGEMTFCGSAHYMAPEVIIGENYSYPADIWSVGATMVHMLTGKQPNYGPSDSEVMLKVKKTQKIIYKPLQPMTKNMKLFMDEILNPASLKRKSAKELLQFLNSHDMN